MVNLGDLFIVKISATEDEQFIINNFVNQPLFTCYSSGPKPSRIKFQRFGFTFSIERTLNFAANPVN